MENDHKSMKMHNYFMYELPIVVSRGLILEIGNY